jgi:hypothetical protein
LENIFTVSKINIIFYPSKAQNTINTAGKMPQNTKSPTKSKRKNTVNYHEAAFTAFNYRLREYIKNGDVSLEDEHQLSKRPPRIDIIVLKKNKDIEIETSWGKIFRAYNIIEYKSPVDLPVSLAVFDKVIHGYAGHYASQENIKLTDMSATIVCSKKPVDLFEILKQEFNYKISHKAKGIYYISQKGVPESKSLAIQIIVSSELDDSDLVLKALQSEIDNATARKVLELPLEDEKYLISLLPWWEVMFLKNGEILSEEADMNEWENLVERMVKRGFKGHPDYEQKWLKKGEQIGELKILDFLSKGHSLEEAKKKFSLA